MAWPRQLLPAGAAARRVRRRRAAATAAGPRVRAGTEPAARAAGRCRGRRGPGAASPRPRTASRRRSRRGRRSTTRRCVRPSGTARAAAGATARRAPGPATASRRRPPRSRRLARVAGERECADLAARLRVQLQRLDRAARVYGQGVERHAGLQAAGAHGQGAAAAAPRQAALGEQRVGTQSPKRGRAAEVGIDVRARCARRSAAACRAACRWPRAAGR